MKPLTKKELRQCIHILEQVRYHIETKHKYHICHIIADNPHFGPEYLRSYLKRWISNMLGNVVSYGAWLTARLDRCTSIEEDRAGRVAWLNWMVDQLNQELKGSKK